MAKFRYIVIFNKLFVKDLKPKPFLALRQSLFRTFFLSDICRDMYDSFKFVIIILFFQYFNTNPVERVLVLLIERRIIFFNVYHIVVQRYVRPF